MTLFGNTVDKNSNTVIKIVPGTPRTVLLPLCVYIHICTENHKKTHRHPLLYTCLLIHPTCTLKLHVTRTEFFCAVCVMINEIGSNEHGGFSCRLSDLQRAYTVIYMYIVGHHLATKCFIDKLLAARGVWT